MLFSPTRFLIPWTPYLQSRDVTHLNLSDCMLSSVAASKLLNSLSGLISLELRGNDLRGDAINTLAALVRRCSLLHTLNLEWNSLGQTDVELGFPRAPCLGYSRSPREIFKIFMVRVLTGSKKIFKFIFAPRKYPKHKKIENS